MNPVNQTALLLVAVMAGTVVSTMGWHWPGGWSSVAVFGGALVASQAAGRITRIVREATA